MTETIFDKIVSGDIPSFKVWEDDNYLAFLTPFPNTPGFTVVIPKKNVGDYLFSLSDAEYQGLLKASKKVARKIEKAFNTPRVAMIVEGTGVAHVHVKLLPLIGELAGKTDVWSKHTEFNEEYQGHITSAEGPRMDDERLEEIRKKIAEATI
ncbi:HIT family protein [Candidatus Saccharibacteria bacterium]|nr:HIT family protein [Candidatus Saccharibacteria bacterium]